MEKDLDVKEMSLEACEKKIRAWADAHRKGNCAVVPPNVAEGIIRKFYGIPEPKNEMIAIGPFAEIVDFSDFL